MADNIPRLQDAATPTRSSRRSMKQFGYKNPIRFRASRRSWSTWVSAAPFRTRRSSTRPSSELGRSPARSRSSRAPRSRSRASSCARACRSAHGHAARRAHVGVLRSPRHRRAAARARLPRRQPQGLRRPRQLHPRLQEQIVFPEIDYDKVDKIHGMNISFVTTAKTDEKARAAPDRSSACRSAK